MAVQKNLLIIKHTRIMKMLIHVTKEVLHRSMMCKFEDTDTVSNCALAVAVRDIFPDAQVSFHYKRPAIYLCDELTNYQQCIIYLPDSATDFMVKFDECTHPSQRLMIPEQSFEIEIPQHIINRIGIKEIEEIINASPTLELVK
jgi:hypothetical protein